MKLACALTSLIKFLLIGVGALSYFPANGQSHPQALPAGNDITATHVNITILNGSTVSINGKTNVNTFNCSNCRTIDQYSKTLKVRQSENAWSLTDAFIKIHSNAFDCGLKEMTKDLNELLCVESYPYLSIVINRIEQVAEGPTNFTAFIALTISGATREVEVPLAIRQQEGKTVCTGVAVLNIADFNIEPPSKLLGLIKVNEQIEVDFNFLLDVSVMEDSLN